MTVGDLPSETSGAGELRIAPAQWSTAIQHTDGPQIVVGGPGTGKTEFLVRRVAHLVEECDVAANEIQVLSFSRRAVADLDQRLHRTVTRPTAPIPAATFHSLAARLIEAHADETAWGTPPLLLTGPEQTALVGDLLRTEPPHAWPPTFRSMLHTATLAAEVTDITLRAAEQMLDADQVAAMAAQRDDWRALGPFLRRYRRELVDRGRIDYAQLLFEATVLFERGVPDVEAYRYVVVDEYQDTSLAQSRLLRAMTARTHNLVTAADPYQSIYSFRGARVANVASFAEEMAHPDGPEPIRIVLTTSFRTPARILTAAERITSRALPGAAGPVEAAEGDGDVVVHVFDQQTAEAEWIAGEIERMHLVDDIPYRNIAVFVRSSQRFVAELSRALERRRIPHDTPPGRVAENPTVKFVLDVVTAATAAPIEQDRAVRSLLLGPSVGLTLGEARTVERNRRADKLSWPEELRRIERPGMAGLADLIANDAWATERSACDGLWQVWLVAADLSDIVSGSTRGDERRAWASLSQVIERWNERNREGTLVDYQRLLAAAEFEARPLLSYEPAATDQLTVTTMHQAKGLEFDVVFIADAVDGVLPDLRVRDSLLGVRHLLPDVPTDAAGYRLFRLQEERRLAYTAMTRARRRVIWTATTTGYELGQGAPSRFLPLVAGVASVADAATPVASDREPVTPAEAEADLRRRLGDPLRPAAERLAALDVLGRGPSWGMRSLRDFSGVRTPGPALGLVDDTASLSATQADGYERCPRRYVLERRLGVSGGDTEHLIFGRLIHSVIEAATRDAIADGLPHPTPEAVAEQLALQFEGADYGGGPYATAWFNRAVTTIQAYLEKRPTTGSVVATEQQFEIEIADRTWRGVIDAVIDVGHGNTQVVDYKTGTRMLTLDEAAESLQLGLYVLAARTDPELVSLGTPIAADFWYLYTSADRKSLATRSFDLTNVDAVAQRLLDISERMAADDWTPVPGDDCDRCPVRRSCPAVPEGAEGFVA